MSGHVHDMTYDKIETSCKTMKDDSFKFSFVSFRAYSESRQ